MDNVPRKCVNSDKKATLCRFFSVRCFLILLEVMVGKVASEFDMQVFLYYLIYNLVTSFYRDMLTHHHH